MDGVYNPQGRSQSPSNFCTRPLQDSGMNVATREISPGGDKVVSLWDNPRTVSSTLVAPHPVRKASVSRVTFGFLVMRFRPRNGLFHTGAPLSHHRKSTDISLVTSLNPGEV